MGSQCGNLKSIRWILRIVEERANEGGKKEDPNDANKDDMKKGLSGNCKRDY